MEKIKNSIAAKTVAFILIVIIAAASLLSAAVVGVNAYYQWYSKTSDNVTQDIYYEVASRANEQIISQLYMYSDEGTDVISISDDVELLYGEDATKDFGYKIKLINRENEQAESTMGFKFDDEHSDTRIVNEEFINSENVLYHQTFEHYDAEIDIYIGGIGVGSIPDELYTFEQTLENVYKYKNAAAVTAAAGIIAMMALFVFLITVVGRKTNTSKIILKLPIELCIAAVVIIGIILMLISKGILDAGRGIDMLVLTAVIDAVVLAAVVLGLLIVIAIKARQHVLWRSSLCFMIFKVLKVIMRGLKNACCFAGRKIALLLNSIPLVWKSAVVVLAGIIVNFFITVLLIWNYYGGSSILWLLWILGAVLVEGFAIYIAVCFRKIREAGRCLADGVLDHKISTDGMHADLKKHAEDLNNISYGMSKAVEEKMKSEHFKTELITNVSHDIKTPLTSIINYVDLLKGEKLENEKATEYIEVLDRQSQRLKKLTEDLVEASKAATGTVALDMHPCKVSILMMQVCGEYDEKLKEKRLEVVSQFKDEDSEIMADGRSMWRIFDNVMSNICKYSQSNTRVYQLIEKKDGKLTITYKNTSEYQLNISEEELMERFVRGDSSRHTEGSGLGLSIAKNLAALQGGNLRINIDGDLFKVIMEFPYI